MNWNLNYVTWKALDGYLNWILNWLSWTLSQLNCTKLSILYKCDFKLKHHELNYKLWYDKQMQTLLWNIMFILSFTLLCMHLKLWHLVCNSNFEFELLIYMWTLIKNLIALGCTKGWWLMLCVLLSSSPNLRHIPLPPAPLMKDIH